MKLVYEEDGSCLHSYLESGVESYLCFKDYFIDKEGYDMYNYVIREFNNYFTDWLNPAPEEVTMFNLEFGEESTEAYLKFLKSGAK